MGVIKKNFILGLVSGIAVISFAGFIVMTVAYFQKSSVAPAEKKENNTILENNKGETASIKTRAVNKKVDIKISDTDWSEGNKNAPITIVIFSDFQCPYCARLHETMREIAKNYPKDVRLVFKYFPLDRIHPYARKAALAAECAGGQGKFWEYADSLFTNQAYITDNYFSQLASDLNLDKAKFSNCLADKKTADKVDADVKQGEEAGVNVTPFSFINGQGVPGAVSYSKIKSIIDGLKK